MRKQIVFAAVLTVTLATLPVLAQSDAISGTWSGSWMPDSGTRDSVTVRFSIEEDAIVGEMVNPESVEFDELRFDAKDLSVVASASDPERGQVTIEARIEDETRLNGRIQIGDEGGELRLTKWTFVPRPR